ncbi:MAG: hypothetical protein RIC95_11950 [Vicingaceae bacterium]
MFLVLDKHIIYEYFKLLAPRKKVAKELDLQVSIESTDSRIVLPRCYLEKCEEYFKGIGTAYFEFYKSFIDGLNQTSKLELIDVPNSLTELQKLETCFIKNYKPYTFIFFKDENLQSKYLNQSMIYDRIAEPNKNWLILRFATGQVVIQNKKKLNSRIKTESFIDSVFCLQINPKRVDIIDSYFNVFSSNIIFNCIKGKFGCVKCFSSANPNHGGSKPVKIKNVKDFFGKNKTSIKFSNNSSITHERIIRIDSLFIECTHDFAEINPSNLNWSLLIKHCKEKEKDHLSKIANYSPA